MQTQRRRPGRKPELPPGQNVNFRLDFDTLNEVHEITSKVNEDAGALGAKASASSVLRQAISLGLHQMRMRLK